MTFCVKMENLLHLSKDQHAFLHELFHYAAAYYNKNLPNSGGVNRAMLMEKARPIIQKIRSAEHDPKLRDYIQKHMVIDTVYELIREHDFAKSGFDIKQHEFKDILGGDEKLRQQHLMQLGVDSPFTDEEKAELKNILSKEVINIRMKFGMDKVNLTILDKTGNRAEGTLNPMFEHYLSAVGYRPCSGGTCPTMSYQYGGQLDSKGNVRQPGFFICYRHFPNWVKDKEEYELLDYNTFLKLRNERFLKVAEADKTKKAELAAAQQSPDPRSASQQAERKFMKTLNYINSKYGDRVNFFTPDFVLYQNDGSKLAVEISGIRNNESEQRSYNAKNKADKPKVFALAGMDYQIYKSDHVWVMYQWGLQHDPRGINVIDNKKAINTAFKNVLLRAFGMV